MDTTQNPNTNIPQTNMPPPASTPPPVLPTEKKEGNNIFIIFLIVITLFVLLGLAGFIIISFLANPKQESSDRNRVYVTSAPTLPPTTPTPASEEEEIESLTIEDPNTEIDSLNQDLNSL